jgi:hypothetical protein
MAEGIFQGAIEDVNPNLKELLDSVAIPSHLLFLGHPFRDNLVDCGFGESGRYSTVITVTLAVIGHRIGIQF